jgi:hypothetical protein
MSDRPAPRFRKTKTDKWAVMAPVEDLEKALAEGGSVDVLKRSGDWSTFTVASLGKPFDVDGVQMCYGYGPDDNADDKDQSASAPSGSTGGGGRSRTAAPIRAKAASQPPDSSPERLRRPPPSSESPPHRDPSEPMPEYQGGPEDEWDGYF